MLISECVCFAVQSVKLLGLKNILDWLIIQSSKRRTIKVMIHKKKNYDNNVGFFSFILFTAWSLCFCLHIQYLFVIGWELITTPEDRISNTWLELCTVNCFFFWRIMCFFIHYQLKWLHTHFYYYFFESLSSLVSLVTAATSEPNASFSQPIDLNHPKYMQIVSSGQRIKPRRLVK